MAVYIRTVSRNRLVLATRYTFSTIAYGKARVIKDKLLYLLAKCKNKVTALIAI